MAFYLVLVVLGVTLVKAGEHTLVVAVESLRIAVAALAMVMVAVAVALKTAAEMALMVQFLLFRVFNELLN
jgi:hypothetical protein